MQAEEAKAAALGSCKRKGEVSQEIPKPCHGWEVTCGCFWSFSYSLWGSVCSLPSHPVGFGCWLHPSFPVCLCSTAVLEGLGTGNTCGVPRDETQIQAAALSTPGLTPRASGCGFLIFSFCRAQGCRRRDGAHWDVLGDSRAMSCTSSHTPAAGPAVRAGPTGPHSSTFAEVLVMLCSATEPPKLTPQHCLSQNLCGSVQTPLLIAGSVWRKVRKIPSAPAGPGLQ